MSVREMSIHLGSKFIEACLIKIQIFFFLWILRLHLTILFFFPLRNVTLTFNLTILQVHTSQFSLFFSSELRGKNMQLSLFFYPVAETCFQTNVFIFDAYCICNPSKRNPCKSNLLILNRSYTASSDIAGLTVHYFTCRVHICNN